MPLTDDSRDAPPTAAPAMPVTAREGRALLWFGAALAVLAVMTWYELFIGWIPWDDGGMALSAQRVLEGATPHVTFDDPWTGGWSYFQSWLFAAFGPSLRLLRIPMFAAWLGGAVLLQRIAIRFVAPTLAGALAIGGALWSLYAWHLPLLNWFYFPCALAAAYGVVRFEETGRWRWLVAAGAAAGVAILTKVTGLYVLAALLLWSVSWAGDSHDAANVPSRGFTTIAALSLLVFGAFVWVLVRGLPPSFAGSAAVHFLVPNFTIAVWVLFRCWRGGRDAFSGAQRLAAAAGATLAGATAAVAPFVFHYASTGALGALYDGVFVRPRVRLTDVAFGPPGRLATVAALVMPVVLLLAVRRAAASTSSGAGSTTWRSAMVLGAAWGAAAHLPITGASGAVSLSIRAVVIVLPIVALAWDALDRWDGTRGRVVLLFVGLAATSQLMQVPYADFAYFLFVAPVGLVGTAALLSRLRVHGPAVTAFWASFVIAAGIGHPLTAVPDQPPAELAALPFRRGGIMTTRLDSTRLARLAAVMRTLPDGPLYVVGSAPELPFLLERPSASRVVYDMLADSTQRDARALMASLDAQRVGTVVLHHGRPQLGGVDSASVRTLRAAFPNERLLWPYEVRWRTPPTAASSPDTSSPRRTP